MDGPVPPHERWWRHPSELAPPPPEPPKRSDRWWLTATALTSVLAIAALAVVLMPRDRVGEPTAAPAPMTAPATSVTVAAGTTAVRTTAVRTTAAERLVPASPGTAASSARLAGSGAVHGASQGGSFRTPAALVAALSARDFSLGGSTTSSSSSTSTSPFEAVACPRCLSAGDGAAG